MYMTRLVAFALALGAAFGSLSGVSFAGDEPRTKLEDGFVVPAGSRAVGPVFWYPACRECFRASPSSSPSEETWRALLEIESDPIGVYDDLAAQARELGVPFPSSGDMQNARYTYCSENDDGDLLPLGSLEPSEVDRIDCYGISEGEVAGRFFYVTVDVRWGGPVRHALLTVGHSRSPVGIDHFDADGTEIAHPVELPSVHDRRQPEVGDPIGAYTNAITTNHGVYRLVRGTRLATEAIGLTADFYVVLRVTGNARDAMEAYAKQVGREPGVVGEDNRPPRVQRLRIEVIGDRVLYFSGGPSDGGFTEFVTDPSGEWILGYAASD